MTSRIFFRNEGSADVNLAPMLLSIFDSCPWLDAVRVEVVSKSGMIQVWTVFVEEGRCRLMCITPEREQLVSAAASGALPVYFCVRVNPS
jgi:hypothetical protein